MVILLLHTYILLLLLFIYLYYYIIYYCNHIYYIGSYYYPQYYGMIPTVVLPWWFLRCYALLLFRARLLMPQTFLLRYMPFVVVFFTWCRLPAGLPDAASPFCCRVAARLVAVCLMSYFFVAVASHARALMRLPVLMLPPVGGALYRQFFVAFCRIMLRLPFARIALPPAVYAAALPPLLLVAATFSVYHTVVYHHTARICIVRYAGALVMSAAFMLALLDLCCSCVPLPLWQTP